MSPTSISDHIWRTRYRHQPVHGPVEHSIEDSWHRVAHGLAQAETEHRSRWEQRFYKLLEDFKFLPGGRILAGVGTGRRVTLLNCFVMGAIDDSMHGIFHALEEGAVTMQQGGGVGYDFSSLRPHGSHVAGTDATSSGPVSFMRVWDTMCATVMSTGARRGAMMATLRCDHPDIESFIDAKRDSTELRHFNLSVLVSDAFMKAVETNGDWPLVFPSAQLSPADLERYPQVVERRCADKLPPTHCRVLSVCKARELWQRMLRASYECAEPGVLFIDRINRGNNLWYCETINATNPCGEVPLPPYGACDLGSLNLTRFVRDPFAPNARLDLDPLADAARIATRMLDNVIDVSSYPLGVQRESCLATRRVGLGVTGLADTLVMLGLRYASEAANRLCERLMRTICHAAYESSVSLAREKLPFPKFCTRDYLAGEFIQSLPAAIRDAIAETGIRNSHLIAIAPTGTVSLLADNVSSGIEPVYASRYRRAVLTDDGTSLDFELEDYACRLWRRQKDTDTRPPHFVSVPDLGPEDHLSVQAALQPYVDNAISKTVNVSPDAGFDVFSSIYRRAYELGLKGCTAFRSNPVTGAVLTPEQAINHTPHCCTLEREAD